jgi:phage FluMu protein Com
MTFTPKIKRGTLDKHQARCGDCNRRLFDYYAFLTGGPIAVALEIKCPRCGKVVNWPVLALEPDN